MKNPGQRLKGAKKRITQGNFNIYHVVIERYTFNNACGKKKAKVLKTCIFS